MPNQPKKSEPKETVNAALKYSGMAFQMVVAIGVGVLIGTKLDDRYGDPEGGIITALGALLGLAAAMYLVFKDLK